ncbi:hypothetical protein D3C76_1812540 [compost metagenome]
MNRVVYCSVKPGRAPMGSPSPVPSPMDSSWVVKNSGNRINSLPYSIAVLT